METKIKWPNTALKNDLLNSDFLLLETIQLAAFNFETSCQFLVLLLLQSAAASSIVQLNYADTVLSKLQRNLDKTVFSERLRAELKTRQSVKISFFFMDSKHIIQT